MARKFTPRHKAKEIEAERTVPKPPRFNQKPAHESGDIMFPLNRTIPTGVVSLLDLGCRSIERTITESAEEHPRVHLQAFADVTGANDVLTNFIAQCADTMAEHNQQLAIGNSFSQYTTFFHYEGTVYAVTQLDLEEGYGIEQRTIRGDSLYSRLQNGYVRITGEALPDIIKLKHG